MHGMEMYLFGKCIIRQRVGVDCNSILDKLCRLICRIKGHTKPVNIDEVRREGWCRRCDRKFPVIYRLTDKDGDAI